MVEHRSIASDAAVEPVRIKQALAQQIRRALKQRNGTHQAGWVMRVTVPIPPLDPFCWLQAQAAYPRVYWSGRNDHSVVAGVGAAHLLTADAKTDIDALQALLAPVLAASDPEARYLGGLRFDAHHAATDGWQVFGAYRFVLPRFELRLRDGEAHLACYLYLPADADREAEILAALEALRLEEAGWQHALPLPSSRDDRPGLSGWRHNVNWALDAFGRGLMEKVVLARKATFNFEDPIEPLLLLHTLKQATPSCFHFCFQLEPGTAFLGASPEQLFRREGRAIRSEAVAGTRPRGTSDDDDARLRNELLHSEKDQREYAYVRDSIARALRPLSEVLHVDAEPSVMRLARGRHLVSGVQGTLKPGVTDFEILRRLHPTPAVGGHPTREAVEAIRELEPFDRGWYAGPIGWIRHDAAEFAVAIRSGLVRQDELALFSGAGIVQGSVPDSEWDEIEHKISDFINVLGLDLRCTK